MPWQRHHALTSRLANEWHFNDVRDNAYLSSYQTHLNQTSFSSADAIQDFIDDVNASVDSLVIIASAADSDSRYRHTCSSSSGDRFN